MELYILLGIGLGIAAWLVLTWWNGPDKQTFKNVIQDMFRDVREVFAPFGRGAHRFWVWAGPKVTNSTTWAAILTNFALAWPTLASDPIGQALLARYPILYTIGALVALFATRQASAPTKIPSGPLVNNAALA